MQYWLEEAEIARRECRLGGYKLSDYTLAAASKHD